MSIGESAGKPDSDPQATGITRADIVRVARGYVGTPFAHQGRQRGRGVDCVGLVLCVAEDLGLKDKAGIPLKRADYYDYGPLPAERFVHDQAVRRLIAKPLDSLADGDVVTMRVPHLPTHAAIICERKGELYMVHAYSGGPAKVVEHILSGPWYRRIVGVFSFPGVA